MQNFYGAEQPVQYLSLHLDNRMYNKSSFICRLYSWWHNL